MLNHKGIVWAFVDFSFLLCVTLLIPSQMEKKDSNDIDKISPKIFLFIEEVSKGEYKVKCNGRYVDSYTLSEIVKLSVKENVDHVEVEARVEEQIPHGYVISIKNAVKSAGIIDKDGKRILKVQWNSDSLTNFASK